MTGPGKQFEFPDPRQVLVDIAGLQQIFSTPASSHFDLFWEPHQLAFEAIAETTTLAFSSLNNAGFWGPVLDNVSVEEVNQSVPEPTSFLSLAALGILGAGSILKRQLKS